MSIKVITTSIFFLIFVHSIELKASDWKSLVGLRGRWLFTVGDDPEWARPGADVSDWDTIDAPWEWEHYYEGYNGYAWYRKYFSISNLSETEFVDLFLGVIDDVDEVFVNGYKVGQSGDFPPNYKTAYNQERHYLVPTKILNNSKNLIAVRVYDEGLEGGFVRADRFGFYDDRDQARMAINLRGTWKFTTENFGDMHNPRSSEERWHDIYVPMTWESQGYEGYDGRAWYRKRFSVPERLKGQDLYIVLGKIDDFDEVYLNGELIGEVQDLNNYSRFQRDQVWQLYRIYEIPSHLLRSKNMISVEVLDSHGEGGIYEGPIGIMKETDVQSFREKIRWQRQDSGWNSFFKELIRLLD
ncbi:beta galactosidase jelly roll domain-containing protein [uncultured Sunxiuqinia sp.]|uniref:beta galactosidase jelly roll domain-containing protein n=1 Tax=uncultured Sunxiuqinia sp. TaxID=1573825 RepID=UPI002AA7DCD1|nr:beta galactosidase jelly roll domain-containing protein [uncultured Sunxiuqinia sp.]